MYLAMNPAKRDLMFSLLKAAVDSQPKPLQISAEQCELKVSASAANYLRRAKTALLENPDFSHVEINRETLAELIVSIVDEKHVLVQRPGQIEEKRVYNPEARKATFEKNSLWSDVQAALRLLMVGSLDRVEISQDCRRIYARFQRSEYSMVQSCVEEGEYWIITV